MYQQNNRVSVAFAAVYTLGEYEFYGEVLSNNFAGGGEGSDAIPSTGSSSTQEAVVGETVGTLGIMRHVSKNLVLSFGVSYDSKSAMLLRPGIEHKF